MELSGPRRAANPWIQIIQNFILFQLWKPILDFFAFCINFLSFATRRSFRNIIDHFGSTSESVECQWILQVLFLWEDRLFWTLRAPCFIMSIFSLSMPSIIHEKKVRSEVIRYISTFGPFNSTEFNICFSCQPSWWSWFKLFDSWLTHCLLQKQIVFQLFSITKNFLKLEVRMAVSFLYEQRGILNL